MRGEEGHLASGVPAAEELCCVQRSFEWVGAHRDLEKSLGGHPHEVWADPVAERGHRRRCRRCRRWWWPSLDHSLARCAPRVFVIADRCRDPRSSREPPDEPHDHNAAISQIRLDTDGRVYYRRKRAEGKKSLEAIGCLKRRISDAIYRQLLTDAGAVASRDPETGPGGHCGATQESSAVDLPPHIDTSDQPLPGPA